MSSIATLLAASPDLDAREARWLLAQVLQCPPIQLLTAAQREVSVTQEMAYLALRERRRRGEPLAYLLGHWEFWSLDLIITPAVLIPRPETELLVAAALYSRPVALPQMVVDLGTGSGAVALAIAKERPNWQVVATDCSPGALDIAQRNARRLGLTNIEFRAGIWLEPLAGRRFDLIISNPPYVACHDPHLGDLQWEPQLALLAGADGRDALSAIATDARSYLVAAGVLALEHGSTQGAWLRAVLTHLNYQEIQTLVDLEDRERVTVARYF